MRATTQAAVAVALGLGLWAGPGAVAAPRAEPPASPGPQSAPTTVSDAIVGFTFVVGWASLNAPEQMVRIRTGDSITFDAMPQALYLKQPGDKGSVTFNRAGYYTYRCAEHPEFPGMTGLVFV